MPDDPQLPPNQGWDPPPPPQGPPPQGPPPQGPPPQGPPPAWGAPPQGSSGAQPPYPQGQAPYGAPPQYQQGQYQQGPPPPPYGSPPPASGDKRKVALAIGALVLLALIAVAAVALIGGKDKDKGKTDRAGGTSTTGPVGGTSTTDAACSPPDGFNRISDRTNGYRLFVPRSWKQVDLKAPNAAEQFRRVIKANPNLGDPDATYNTLRTRGVLFAIEGDPKTKFSPNLNLLKIPEAVPNAPSPAFKDQLKTQLESIGSTVEAVREHKVDGRTAIETIYRLPVRNPDGAGSTTVAGRQYYVSNGTNTFILSVTTDDAARDRDTVNTILQSLRAEACG